MSLMIRNSNPAVPDGFLWAILLHAGSQLRDQASRFSFVLKAPRKVRQRLQLRRHVAGHAFPPNQLQVTKKGAHEFVAVSEAGWCELYLDLQVKTRVRG